jgi:hypothetical protein
MPMRELVTLLSSQSQKMLNEQHGKKKVIGSMLRKLAQTFKQDLTRAPEVVKAADIQTHVPSTTSAMAATADAPSSSTNFCVLVLLILD